MPLKSAANGTLNATDTNVVVPFVFSMFAMASLLLDMWIEVCCNTDPFCEIPRGGVFRPFAFMFGLLGGVWAFAELMQRESNDVLITATVVGITAAIIQLFRCVYCKMIYDD